MSIVVSEVSAFNQLAHPVLHHHPEHRHDDHHGPNIVRQMGNCAKCCNLSSTRYINIISDHPYLYDVRHHHLEAPDDLILSGGNPAESLQYEDGTK